MKLTNNQIGRMQLVFQEIFYLNDGLIWNRQKDVVSQSGALDNERLIAAAVKMMELFQDRNELMMISRGLKDLYNINRDIWMEAK